MKSFLRKHQGKGIQLKGGNSIHSQVVYFSSFHHMMCLPVAYICVCVAILLSCVSHFLKKMYSLTLLLHLKTFSLTVKFQSTITFALSVRVIVTNVPTDEKIEKAVFSLKDQKKQRKHAHSYAICYFEFEKNMN